MDVSIVIPAYNASKTIEECLDAITKQKFKGKYEVVVVNDGSTDATPALVGKYVKGVKGRGSAQGVRLISQENAGPAKARNVGARNAKGRIVIFTDSDCVAKPDFVAEMVKPFEDPKVSGVQGAYLCRQREVMGRFGQLEIEQRYEKMRKEEYIDFIGSYAAAYKRRVFLEHKGFDESFPTASGEDTDLSFRISSAGHKFVFNEKANVYHYHPTSFLKYLRVKFFRGYWRVLVYRKHKDKVMADSYTSQTIKLQMGMCYLLGLSLFGFFAGYLVGFNFIQELGYYLTIFSSIVLFATTLRFFLYALGKDVVVAFASIPIQLLRTFAFCKGFVYGVLKAASGRL